MLKSKIDFDRMCDIMSKWNWNELKLGLEKSIISNNDVISYAVFILSENIEQFDKVLELSIAAEDEVEKIILQLSSNELVQDFEKINSKWVFAIIYYAYINSMDMIYDVIEDVYTEFGYPEEISNLIEYMPCNDRRPIDVKLNEYIETYKNIWN